MGCYPNHGLGAAFSTCMKLFHVGRRELCPSQVTWPEGPTNDQLFEVIMGGQGFDCRDFLWDHGQEKYSLYVRLAGLPIDCQLHDSFHFIVSYFIAL